MNNEGAAKSKVLMEKEGHLAFVTLNRPDELNCFDYETLTQLEQTLDQIRFDRDIRAVIFTGAGERSFSTGADLKERRTMSEAQVRQFIHKIRFVFDMVEELPQPTIAAINGFCFGGGFEMALACDFRYAVDSAKLGMTEVSWAIIPGAGGTQRLPRLIGKGKAKELILTARKIDAATAESLGILNGVTTREGLIPKCRELAEEIMQNGPLAVIQAKYAINYGTEVDLKTGLKIETKAYETIIPTKDRVEALNAFSEKRKPQFRGE
ncbi:MULTISPECIES: enoyl-CoA hydratase-related protein [Aneurinibacillus]|uniref:Enoyl-CoA hydratase/carnithine racemase n=1 Tax=Aneurinibacillus thermoaerophilus TaxID=143495 RepID=A0A1G7XRI3_ANETH|nr:MULTISPECIES: enoyl-CoA hydratase-related protein [Aneurinibacillus]AMA73709.1 enoyl-CoA hydratase [Aneurinibacillus sp. XH2]MED0677394.1 enoyl-CoA hydratase-related protein [Aneurinibacillus thermoaerophilus]MED0679484.1 enoyl-CoA hydratase-related protein [Aneurinibacillus thermoaerophilus]MED0737945.1 enoyl-CoA hydratase-related protein [Aneurinibacillus thermoaerophilus]MED0756367.1 enoyl-CoA hydratase-related protein [Aneurinibacillus thermoaerophilus]